MTKKVILVTTLGHSWQVVPELIGFTNPSDYDFYQNHPQLSDILKIREETGIKNSNELWVITTDSNYSNEQLVFLDNWISKKVSTITRKAFILKSIEDILDKIHCDYMTDLIYRVVLRATQEVESIDDLFLSLTGGRKTMSADMQEAGNIFGCRAMLHVIDKGKIDRDAPLLNNEHLEYGKYFTPIVTYVDKKPSSIVYLPTDLREDPQFYVNEGSTTSSTFLIKEVKKRQKMQASIALNFYQDLSKKDKNSNFHLLYSLEPQKIKQLKETSIEEKEELLRKLPKAELHCHLGGIATPSEIIRIAKKEQNEIDNIKEHNRDFKNWLDSINKLIKSSSIDSLRQIAFNKEGLRKRFDNVPEPFNLIGFVNMFANRDDMLEKIIYGDYLDNNKFKNIGIENYEALGDLQGSGLLKTRNTIKEACIILSEKAKEENVIYFELRCSPQNYVSKDLTADEVIKIITESLCNKSTLFKLIFIPSRHGSVNKIEETIHITKNALLNNSKNFKDIFVGFDLAGNEQYGKPSELRELFLPLLKDCIKITIHAGETESADSIWEAVYHLSADRIGHGLKLYDKRELLDKFIDRKISVEMCPSSNMQIVGFNMKDNKFDRVYPLKRYLQDGLKVTINTDNPGISRTTFSNEYLVASKMVDGGLSIWDTVQIIKNSFTSAFCKFEERRRVILEAEKEIVDLLQTDY